MRFRSPRKLKVAVERLDTSDNNGRQPENDVVLGAVAQIYSRSKPHTGRPQNNRNINDVGPKTKALVTHPVKNGQGLGLFSLLF